MGAMKARYYVMGIVLIAVSFPVELLAGKLSFLSTWLAQNLFWFGLGIVSVLIVLEIVTQIYNEYNDNFRTPRTLLFESKERIDKERETIKKLLEFDAENCSHQKLSDHFNELMDSNFSREALAPLAFKWFEHVELTVHEFNTYYNDKEIEALDQQISEKKKKLKQTKADVHYQKTLEEEHLTSRKEEFLEENKNRKFVHAEYLDEEQKTWLEEAGFVRDHQWCIQHKETEEFMIRTAKKESTSHAYLMGAIYEYVDEHATVEMLDTKSPDVVFEYAGNSWAIEVETGSVLKKSKKQLLEKVKRLESKYPETWFFVVTNKNLISKYKKYGQAFDRSAIVDHLDSIFYPDGYSNTPQ
ncbi:hypothetical protein HOH30_00770 [Candidatus Woesearchaeota archaeon]|nr:hypothetical protein [Candidatus Woesearchaeota archaeon]